MRRTVALIGAVILLTGCVAPYTRPTAGEDRVAAWLDANRARPPVLRMFLQRMPKGGDIHVHLSGAVYAERYVDWAARSRSPLCAEDGTNKVIPCSPQSPNARPITDALRDPTFYNALVDSFSTRNLAHRRQSPHDQFFGAFGRFSAATADRWPDMVVEVASRAADQHVSYLELMVTFGGPWLPDADARDRFDPNDLDGSRQRFEQGLPAAVQKAQAQVDELERGVAGLLSCGRDPAPPACGVERRYLQQTTRTREPHVVFAQLVLAFELARTDRRVVGINMVAPEDDRVALRDYSLHMRIVGWLAGRYPDVNVALHAGELALGLVPPADLRFHVREAVEVGRARRIGHGVAIAYERDAAQLLATLRQRQVLVEICLTSNDVILGVSGARHPFPDYLKAGVPVTLATDDEGVSRIDLTNEYLRAAETYGLGYRQLKELARNSLRYSFLAGPDLWKPGPGFELVPACAGDRPESPPSAGCRAFLEASDKARVQWAHERELDRFETMDWAAAIR